MTHTKPTTAAPAVHHQASRRYFMQQAGALSVLAGAGAPLALNLLAAGSAAAQSTNPGGYKAIVCLFMFGGNDAFNMVLPTDAQSWQAYRKMRSADTIGLQPVGTPPIATAKVGSSERMGGVLPIVPSNAQGLTYALHPTMGKVKGLFDAQRLAIVSNIGPLVVPTTKIEYITKLSHPRPARLFSHNDQQSMWQTMQPEGATIGWGGRMADLIDSSKDRSTFTAISAAGNAVWLSGEKVRQYQVTGNGAERLGADAGGNVYGSKVVAEHLKDIVGKSSGGHRMEDYLAAVSDRSIAAEGDLRKNLPLASHASFGTPATPYVPNLDARLQYFNPLSGLFEFNPLAHQLQVVARLIAAAQTATTHPKRQVFFVSMGGFDTHSGQAQTHANLMAKLDQALQYFDDALGRSGTQNMVTTFTASDFGRSFTSNGDGTDHGWGAHQFVMGGAVKGGKLYGAAPLLVAPTASSGEFASSDQVRNGALLPSTSVDQLGGTLGRWFGLSDGNLNSVFPNLANFNKAPTNMALFG